MLTSYSPSSLELAQTLRNTTVPTTTYPPSCYIKGVPPNTNQMNNQPHPIEVAIAITLVSVEALLWFINELAGFHTATATITTAPAHIQPLYELQSLTVRQLQVMTNSKSKGIRKHQLLALAIG